MGAIRKLTAIVLLLALFSAVPGAAGISAADAAGTAIVNPKQTYTYDIMVRDLQRLAAAYPDLIKLESLGKSEYGRDIWQADLG